MRIVFAWELGAGLGHVARIAPWLVPLSERGAKPLLALHDLRAAADAPAFAGAPLVQAPRLAHGPLRSGFEASSYAELLLNAGYGNADILATLVRAWQTLFELSGARALVADHAPTAILAARLARLPVLHLCDGFSLPPCGAAALSFGEEARRDPERFRRAQARVLETVNRILASARQGPLAHLGELLHTDSVVLATYAEIDHYRGHARAIPYAGHFDSGTADPAGWRPVPGPRILAYLKPAAPNFEAVVGIFERIAAQTRIYASGMLRPASSSAGLGLTWSAQPLPMAAAANQCDLVVCHGGHGTVCTALLAGKPLLLLPEVYEQMMTARNVESLGAGAWLHPVADGRALRRALSRGLEDGAMRAAADAFRVRHAVSQASATARLAEHADRLIGLANQPRP